MIRTEITQPPREKIKIGGRKTTANFMKTFKIKEIKGKEGWVT